LDNVTGAEVGDVEALVRLFKEVISLALLLIVGFQENRFSFWTVPPLSVHIREFSNNVSKQISFM
jgi:hypothetical protein